MHYFLVMNASNKNSFPSLRGIACYVWEAEYDARSAWLKNVSTKIGWGSIVKHSELVKDSAAGSFSGGVLSAGAFKNMEVAC